MRVKSRLDALEKRCEKIFEHKKLVEDLQYKIKNKKNNIKIVQALLEERRHIVASKVEYRNSLVKNNLDTIKKFPQYENNVKNLKDYVDKRQDNNATLETKRSKLEDDLKYRIRHDINKLIKYIFPISEIITKPLRPDTTGDTAMALEDASRTAYVRGRWVMQYSQNESQLVIVAPSLPSNGDYSQYNDWVATNKDGVPNSNMGTNETLSSNNHAYRISAALTYTTQLVHLFSFYLDVRLPYKLLYG